MYLRGQWPNRTPDFNPENTSIRNIANQAVRLEKHEFRELRKKCKQCNVTVNSAIAVALLFAENEKHSVVEERYLGLKIPMDMRQELTENVKYDRLGLYIAVVGSLYKISTKLSFWDQVKKFDIDVKANLRRDAFFQYAMLPSLKILGHSKWGIKAAEVIIKSFLPTGPIFTNLGNLTSLEKDEPQTLENFGAQLVPGKYEPFTCIIFSLDEVLTLSFTYDKNVYKSETADQLFERVIAILKENGGYETEYQEEIQPKIVRSSTL